MVENSLSLVLNGTDSALHPVERSLLKDQACARLRDQIILGRIPPGTRLVEREIAQILHISRVPVREALIELEKEGLLVSTPGGRCVIELTEQDIRELYAVRTPLERLAIELAAGNTSPINRVALLKTLQAMEDAVVQRDTVAFISSDVNIHRCIWSWSGNRHLVKALTSFVGPIFMFTGMNARHHDWMWVLKTHRAIADGIIGADAQSALANFEQHQYTSLEGTLRICRELGTLGQAPIQPPVQSQEPLLIRQSPPG